MLHTSMSRRGLLIGGAAAACSLPLLGSRVMARQTMPKVTLALDWFANANHAGIFMARENGYFTDAGLDVEIFVPADPTTVLQTVGAGRDTFGLTYQSDVLQARSQGVKVKAIAGLVQHPLNSMMVLASSDIQSPADLAGKTIGMAGTPSDELTISTMLENQGLTIDDVELVNVGFDLMPAVMSGKTDAVVGVYWTHETILAEHEGTPVRYFKVQDYGVPDYYELVLVTGDDTIASQRPMVSAMLGALRKGYDAAAADPTTAIDVLVAESPDLVADVEAEGLDLLIPEWTDNGQVPWGSMTVERWEAFADWQSTATDLAVDVNAADAVAVDLFPVEDATPMATPAS